MCNQVVEKNAVYELVNQITSMLRGDYSMLQPIPLGVSGAGLLRVAHKLRAAVGGGASAIRISKD